MTSRLSVSRSGQPETVSRTRTRDPTGGVHLDAVDHAEIGDRPTDLRIVHPVQRLTDLRHQWMFSGRALPRSGLGLRVVHVPSVGEIA